MARLARLTLDTPPHYDVVVVKQFWLTPYRTPQYMTVLQVLLTKNDVLTGKNGYPPYGVPVGYGL